jgi:hypothetical protein
MTTRSAWSICCAAAVLSGGAAFAQQQQQPATSQGGAAGQQAAGGQSNPALQRAQAQEFFLASKLVGKSTQTKDGQSAGSIKDVAFNQQGEIFALVDIGNGRWAALPWQVVNAATAKGEQKVELNTTQQALKSAPAVTKDQWGALNNPSFAQGIYSYYKIQPLTAVGGAGAPGGESQGQGSSSGQQQPQPPQPPPQEKSQP